MALPADSPPREEPSGRGLDRESRGRLGLVLALGLLAAVAPRLGSLRPAAPGGAISDEIVVDRAGDRGAGSLREAIVAADRATGRVRIAIRVPRIRLASALPPLVNPAGTVIESEGVEIDASAVSDGAALDVSARGSVIRGLEVIGAPSVGMLVRAAGVRLERVAFRDCEVGILVGDDAQNLVVDRSRFEGNRTGVAISGEAAGSRISRNQFERNAVAAVWQVAPRPVLRASSAGLNLRLNQFSRDETAVVAINVPVLIEDNTFIAPVAAAVFIAGNAVVVRGNRFRSGAAIGILGSELEGALIADNEVHLNRAIGILLRESQDTELRGNRVYNNGYGVVLVFGADRRPNRVSGNLIARQTYDGVVIVGSSPVVRDNHLTANGGVALRVLDFVSASGRRPSAPLLAGNLASDNRSDEPVLGEYRTPDVLQVSDEGAAR